MRKRLVAILSASFLLTVFGGFSCLGDSFRFFVHPDLKDGFCFLVDKSNVSPRYAVTV